MDNRLASEAWIVVVSPRTGKRLAMPCQYNLAVVSKAMAKIQGFGDTTIDLPASDLQEFYMAWRERQDTEMDDYPADE